MTYKVNAYFAILIITIMGAESALTIMRVVNNTDSRMLTSVSIVGE